ncbi:uncharacterized protein METZ01_LOCUS315701, partial [marine metagenome]
MVLLLAKQIITLYHAVQKLFAKDQRWNGLPPQTASQCAK